MTTRQDWLNINTGEFSNSWQEGIYPDATSNELLKDITDGWKLITYECLNDDEFEFCNLMRLK